MLSEFKAFLLKTNALALAIGVIIGTAIGGVVNSLITDVLMPPIGLLLGKVDFSNLFVALGGGTFATLADAKKAGAPTLNYGLFLNSLVNFVIIGFCVFMIGRMAMKEPAPPPGPAMKECGQCGESVLAKARKCRYCASPV